MALLCCPASAFCQTTTTATQTETTVTVSRRAPNYAQAFAAFDKQFHAGRSVSDDDNSTGSLAWLQSYMMLAYLQEYRATGDTRWLDKLVEQFDRILAKRDDRLGRKDVYTSTPLKGWGTATYDKAGWHVFAVHTGMICQAPAEFVFEVKTNDELQAKYGAAAERFLPELEAMVAEANKNFREGAPDKGEGWYTDPGIGIVPLNMSNAMGMVMINLYRTTGEAKYREKVTRLATFYKNCLRDNGDGGYTWPYWPKTSAYADPKVVGEDISHAAINVAFATACAGVGIVFADTDIEKLGQTWLKKVRKGNNEWAAFVDGTGSAVDRGYIPQAAGRWMCVIPWLKSDQTALFYSDVAAAFSGQEITFPSRGLGVANMAYYDKLLTIGQHQ